MTGTCQTCRFFSALQVACRRRAPTIYVAIPDPKGSGAPAPVASFPPVRSDWWCGEHEIDPQQIAANGAGKSAAVILR
jgi:hypothetical protein